MRLLPRMGLIASFAWMPVAAAQSSAASVPSEQPASAPASPEPAASASAPAAPLVLVRPSGAYVHDGFYLRIGLGPAYTGLWGSRPAGSASPGGIGLGLTLAIGGTLGRGVVLGGIVHVTEGESSEGSRSPVGPGTVYGSLVELALLVDWYPEPQKGWHVGGAIGVGSVEVSGSNRSILGGAATGSILGGYDWWIGPEWSLGLLMVATGASKTTLSDSNGVDSGYHLGGGSIAVDASLLFH
jgi:hypothetical protein